MRLAFGGRPLTVTPLCGVRTFLPPAPLQVPASGCLACFTGSIVTDGGTPQAIDDRLTDRPEPVTSACGYDRQPVPSAGTCRFQKVGNDVPPKRAIYKLSELTHLMSQLDHARRRLGLCRPNAFGRPLGIGKIVAVAAPMQTRPKTALLVAYQFSEFQPGLLEV